MRILQHPYHLALGRLPLPPLLNHLLVKRGDLLAQLLYHALAVFLALHDLLVDLLLESAYALPHLAIIVLLGVLPHLLLFREIEPDGVQTLLHGLGELRLRLPPVLPLYVQVNLYVVLCQLHLLRLLLLEQLAGLRLRVDPREHPGQSVLKGLDVLLVSGEQLGDPVLCLLDPLLIVGFLGVGRRVPLLVVQGERP